jgi:hypothetical protein
MTAEIVSGDEGITIATAIVIHLQTTDSFAEYFLQMEALIHIRNG